MEEENTVLRSGPLIDATGILLLLVTISVFLWPLFIFFPPIPPTERDALLETHSPVGLGSSKKPKKKESGRSLGGSPASATATTTTIRDLWIYPIKSCKGIQVAESKVRPWGLEFDRLYTFAQLKSPFPVSLDSPNDEKTAHKWEFITQRQFSLLATVRVELYVPDVDKARGRPLDSKVSDSFLLVRFPWQERGLHGAIGWLAAKLLRGRKAVPEKEFILPVTFPSEREIEARSYSHEQVAIWKETVTALNMEADLPRELRLYLGVSNRLGIFRIDPARLREVYRCAPTRVEAGYQPVTGFQDAYPLHLLNLSSVRDFGAKIENDDFRGGLDPRRFRANIIVDGKDTSPYDEETWKKVRFTGGAKKNSSSTFHVSCRTVRCKMPNVDQENGIRHPVEPDRSLRQLREVDAGARLMGCLGMQLTPLFDEATGPELESWVEVGMEVAVLERGEHLYIRQ
ncbi:molybdenum cofactor sulfurase [Cladorrhinum samala]|uniref:Molybdenum cofactor sulfurase n=1 Tax=Cladorrhinum samala TaxID=585594 RepID=A0AAV9HUA9_9PEZI|nr:molybdenum cofactor sulfurase [Cladorrhinum samala]